MSELSDMYVNVRLYETRLESICFADKLKRATQKWKITQDQQQLLHR